MEIICPNPSYWHDVFEQLSDAAAKADRYIPPPPQPLILGSWLGASEMEKRERWRQTVAWAEKWGFIAIIEAITPDMMHCVEQITGCDTGPFGDPMYLPWSYKLKPVVSREAASEAISRLKTDWEKIAGAELCKRTHPLRLTGKKRRRLVAYADPSVNPPWGTWTRLANGSARREFTRLRAAVNAAIQPLVVDHIDFVHENGDGSAG